jgi:hypothetical protein
MASTEQPPWLNASVASDDEFTGNLFEGYSPVLLDFAVACCILFILLGIPGNLITIIALLRCKKVGCSKIKF